MAESKKTAEKDDRLTWRYQDKTYNELFKKWRKQSKGKHGFYYVDNSNELTYRDGFGFVKEYPEAAERTALRNVYNIIGVTMIIITMTDVFLYSILPWLFSLIGADIYYDKYVRCFYGDGLIILGIYFVMEALKRLLPFLYCYKKLRMPFKVMVPTKISNMPMFRAAVPTMLLVSGIGAAATGFYKEVLICLHIVPVNDIRIPQGTSVAVLYIIINVILIPAISEIYTRGTIMQLLRQFGDGTAVVFSAFLTAMICYNPHQFCYVFISSLIIGYFTIRTGSVITAVIMRICTRAFAYVSFAIDNFLPDDISGVIQITFLLICMMIGMIVFIRFLINHGDNLGMPLESRYLSFSEKVLTAFTCTPIVIGITMMLIITLTRINIEI